jgi:hypothetical protein
MRFFYETFELNVWEKKSVSCVDVDVSDKLDVDV